MKRLLFLLMIVCAGCSRFQSVTIEGELIKWHPVTITFRGPSLSETADDNPFMNYRLDVTFTNGNRAITVPGYFAADGNAAETGASAGNKWRVHFIADTSGLWEYSVSFRTGVGVAVDPDPAAGEPVALDGKTGTITVLESDKTGSDYRARGMLLCSENHYLRFAESGEYFLKGGADSPENFLAYYEFDGTPNASHKYAPHAGDWKPGDPVWHKNQGKNIIGALNYLAGKGMNSVYFLTMNVAGDGKDVWPWTNENERYRFDCSKLAQWDIVFSHMDKLGLLLHVVTQETENDSLLDEGEMGPQRSLYYRELIARFSYHSALVWNLGEENTNTDSQRIAFAEYFERNDPYRHPVVIHTHPGQYDRVYPALLGLDSFDGASLQMADMKDTHSETVKWLEKSSAAGRPWFVCLDEIGPWNIGVQPDSNDYWHDDVRRYTLWGNLMAGGSGCEWYFGYSLPHNDLNCEDWRSRDHLWDMTRIALDFFINNLPFWEMECGDDLLTNKNAWCFAKPGEIYTVYLPGNESSGLLIAKGEYDMAWFNPRTGGDLQGMTTVSVQQNTLIQPGAPPAEPEKDWVILLRKKNN
ncbi:MAG TPA: DUF5060 domain-containing protein [bacterium]|nr:DUF5060 domain-containing protein [bacterium]HPN42540.1 DUF5060 domain-containing protein [bacterium]